MEEVLDNLIKNVRKYNTYSTLKKMEEITRKMFLENSPTIKILNKYYLNSWDISEVTYYLVKHSNDYRGKRILNEIDILRLCQKSSQILEEKFCSNFESLPDTPSKMAYFSHGFSQRQFIFQENHEVFWRFFRNAEILENISIEEGNLLNVDKVLKEIFGFSAKDFNKLLFVLIFSVLRNYDILSEKYKKDLLSFLTEDDYQNLTKIIDYFTADYDEYRNNDLKDKIIYFKPIIKTSNNKLVIPNFYMLFKNLGDALYWVLRNYYYDKKPRGLFPSEFGRLFEKYTENLLNNYLEKNTFKHLEETKKEKIADWQLETEKYIFLIEQKSNLSILKARNIDFQLKDLEISLGTYGNAIGQLDKTEKEVIDKNNKKQIIKMILHYDYLPTTQALKELIGNRVNKSKEELENLLFIGVSDFEILISLLGKEEKLFNKVIERKLSLEKKASCHEGTDFSLVFDEFKIYNNDYLENYLKPKLDYFKNK